MYNITRICLKKLLPLRNQVLQTNPLTQNDKIDGITEINSSSPTHIILERSTNRISARSEPNDATNSKKTSGYELNAADIKLFYAHRPANNVIS